MGIVSRHQPHFFRAGNVYNVEKKPGIATMFNNTVRLHEIYGILTNGEKLLYSTTYKDFTPWITLHGSGILENYLRERVDHFIEMARLYNWVY